MKLIKNILIVSLLMQANQLQAQETGTVTHAGYTFTIPEGWMGQLQQDSYLMGSNTEPGFILLVPHAQKTLEGLKSEIRSGLTDHYSYSFQLVGDIETLNESMLRCKFQGNLGNEQAKGALTGIVDKTHDGLMVIALTTPDKYSVRYEQLSKQVGQSVEFAPNTAPSPPRSGKHSSHELVQQFTHVKLTFMNSYYSSSYTDGGISGGYSDTEEISLCASGYFTFNSSSETTAGGNYSSMYGTQRSNGDGTWQVIPSGASKGILELKFNNGNIKRYEVEINQKGETYLDGYRYYRTTGKHGSEYAPNCP
jgi:hypothetical protein